MTTKTKTRTQNKTLDLPRLERLAAEIAPFENGGDKTELLHRLETEEKMKLTFGQGQAKIALAGITRASSRGLEAALKLWAQAARRAVLRG